MQTQPTPTPTAESCDGSVSQPPKAAAVVYAGAHGHAQSVVVVSPPAATRPNR